jgi:UDP-glucose 4-epimerase
MEPIENAGEEPMNSPASKPLRRVCVTGGAGFIGTRVTSALMERGLQVNVIDNLSVGRRERVPAGATFIAGDIRDAHAMGLAVDGCDAVVHLAARVAIRSSFDFVVEDADVNYVGTASVLRAAKDAAVGRVVFASSMGVYADAPSPSPIPESHATVPASPYGISKLAGENLVQLYCRHAGLQSVVLRLFNTFGPGQQYSPYVGVVTIFANRARKGEQIEIFGDGQQARDFVHVDDVASAFAAAAESTSTGEVYNIGSGVATTVNQVCASVCGIMETSLAPVHKTAAAGELRNSVADISKAQRHLGYQPVRMFATSVRSVVSDILRAADDPGDGR